jgi:2-polyprenyl-3-methyl-5-hydroxy-6-metoxy-1,4-benzoquinol methylase
MQIRHKNDEQYFQELAETTRKYILPFIGGHKTIEPGMRVLEIGCGVGGNLQPFRELGCTIHGIDIAEAKIESARRLLGDTGQQADVHIACQDFLTMPAPEEKFDFIFIHDVIEHIYDKDAFFQGLKAFIKPDGMIYFAFPAWQMPFGGHQQICRNKIASHLPFVHILPPRIYRAYLKGLGEGAGTIDELLDIKRCKTPIERFRKLVGKHGYSIVKEKLYFINPHYETKFGLKPRKLAGWISAVPYLRNFFSTTCFYLIKANED